MGQPKCCDCYVSFDDYSTFATRKIFYISEFHLGSDRIYYIWEFLVWLCICVPMARIHVYWIHTDNHIHFLYKFFSIRECLDYSKSLLFFIFSIIQVKQPFLPNNWIILKTPSRWYLNNKPKCKGGRKDGVQGRGTWLIVIIRRNIWQLC